MENKDPILNLFIETVNKTDISMGITLNVRGEIITGNLISYKRYLREVGEEFGRADGEQGIGNTFEDALNLIADEVEKLTANTEGDEGNKSGPNFIHLSDISIFGQTNFTSKHWRGKLSSVDGFIFGRMVEEY